MKYLKITTIMLAGLMLNTGLVLAYSFFFGDLKTYLNPDPKESYGDPIIIKETSDDTQPIENEDVIEEGLFKMANQEKRFRKLEWNDCLAEVAKEKSREMVERNFFFHEDPQTGKVETWDRISNQCFQYKAAGENLVSGGRSANRMHTALMQSPSHRQNILSLNYALIGVGCYKQTCTQVFASKL